LSNLRMCAILHDIGHCPFSHVSETVLMDFPSIQSEKLKIGGKPHEILGHYILKSDVFKAFFEDLNKEYDANLDIDKTPDYLLGKVGNPGEDQYIADLINGQIDADKLDYIRRDSDFSGVQLALGIDRLLLSLGIEKIQTTEGRLKKLVMDEKGIMSLEQLILAKVMLYSAIYHHQKVRALDHMIISILRMLIDEEIEVNGTIIKEPIDLLKLDDFDLLKLSSGNTKLNDLCRRLKSRQTFKRCLVIASKTIKDDCLNQFYDILEYSEHPGEIRELNKVLAERIGNGCTEFDVAIDLPTTPKLGETQQKIIKIGGEFKALKEIFPQKGWLDAYVANKWKGHIFASDEFREKASKEGINLLEEKFGIKFKDNAIDEAKILPLYKKQKTLQDF
jgi:HD superfamily phosphohydrolase